jgi:thiol-disulfide isomerase/thioredoxin
MAGRKEMLLDFYGRECPHCVVMEPLIKRVEKELKRKIRRLEVWHNEGNAEKLLEYDKGRCGGVPFFYNTGTGGWICGETTYDKLLAWAKGR